MKLNSTTLPEPAWDYGGYEKEVNDIGTLHEMADGSLVYDHVGSRSTFSLRWVGLTSAERTIILTRYQDKTPQTFEPPNSPDESSVTVLVVPGSWRESYIESGGERRYRIEMTLMAQAA